MSDNGVSSYHRFLQGDVGGLEELVRIYGDRLVRFAYGYVKDPDAAEDVAEDAFAALVFKRRNFGCEAAFRSWLYKTARNKCIDHLRKRARSVPLVGAEQIPGGGDFERELFFRERDRQVFDCMQSLPEQYRSALYLAYFDGLSADEIARVMKKSRKQVYNLLARGKSSLKKILIGEGIDYENV